MTTAIWQKCAQALQAEISQGQFNTWIRPLTAELESDGKQLWVRAPNRFIFDWVSCRFMQRIRELMAELDPEVEDIELEVATSVSPASYRRRACPESPGSANITAPAHPPRYVGSNGAARPPQAADRAPPTVKLVPEGEVNKANTFSNFVIGQSNQLAQAAALQVAESPGRAYNPLFIYGGVGLGKTHLMHAVGNLMLERNPNARVMFVETEKFVSSMIQALRYQAMDEFKRCYRTVDALLLDDVHFLSRKERSQEEFFHTFNNLVDGGQQIVMTSDRYHKAIEGVEPRLKSRLGWGLSVCVEPPELETRIAILMKKAEEIALELPDDAAVFIGQKVLGSGRELEGAIKKVNAFAQFRGREVDIGLVKEALWDLFAQQDKMISVDNIQRTVADYYKIKMRDMLSRRRSQSITRPRQVAMTLTRELTSLSLPEIGEAFGGRDHTTVIHACKKVADLRRRTKSIEDDYNNLLRALTN